MKSNLKLLGVMLAELDVAELTLLFGVKGVINLVFELRFSFGFERIFFGEMRESLKPSFNSWKHSGPTVPLGFSLQAVLLSIVSPRR